MELFVKGGKIRVLNTLENRLALATDQVLFGSVKNMLLVMATYSWYIFVVFLSCPGYRFFRPFAIRYFLILLISAHVHSLIKHIYSTA